MKELTGNANATDAANPYTTLDTNHSAAPSLFADKAFAPSPNNPSTALTTADSQHIETSELNTAQQVDRNLSQRKVTLAEGEPLKLAVVGHTNTGKTSILRTLLRDVYFGEVRNEAATTRHVERAVLTDSQTGEALVALYDTPGLEDASGLMDWLEDNTASRRDGIERLQQFLASELADAERAPIDMDYSQEAKVIRQLLASDLAIYVVDAREPVLGKYKDELTVLSWAAIPVMPVFNFTHGQEANITAWQAMLARRALHISARFDSVAFEFDDEMVLWQNLATMMTHPERLKQLMVRRQADWDELYDTANIAIADFLLNIAAMTREIKEEDDPTPTLQIMQEAVRQTERKLHERLLELYKFYDNSIATTPLNLTAYQQDPFDSELLKAYGIRTTSGAAAGALIGMGFDVAALGTTLGLGTALGGLAGGLLSNTSSIADRISGVKRLYIDPATITLLATRSMDLLSALRHRGHAATQAHPIYVANQNANDPAESSSRNLSDKLSTSLSTNGDDLTAPSNSLNSPVQPLNEDAPASVELHTQTLAPWSPEKLPTPLKKARGKPQWSSLNTQKVNNAHELRQDAAWELARRLRR